MAYENIGAGGKQEGYGGGGQQQLQESPYTNYESQEKYMKAGYGGDAYEPAVPPKEEQPNYYSSAPLVSHEEPHGGMKEKVKEKLFAPCLLVGNSTSPTSPDDPKKGVLEKVKDKISPHSS